MGQKNSTKLSTCRRVFWVLIFMLIFTALISFEMETRQKFHARGTDKTQDASATQTDAEELAVNPVEQGSSWKAVLYDNLNGLPTSEANAIVETSDGFIWIGSYAGLIRYDGNTFERMDSAGGIASVICLFVDSQDRLWVGTNANGVAVLENGSSRIWGTKDGLSSASVRAITEDADGLIYVATTEGIVTIDQNMDVTALEDDRIKDEYIRDIRCGADGLIYGLTQSSNLFTLKQGAVETFLNHEESTVTGAIGVLPDDSNPGYVYLGTDDSNIYYGELKNNFETLEIKDVSPLSNIERMENLGGKLWLCAGNGIGCLDDSGFHLLNNAPMESSVGHVMMDYVGNLWFTSSRQGVMKIVANQFTDINEVYGLDEAVVNTTCLYNDQLFIGTDNGLTVLSDGAKIESLPLTKAVTSKGDTVNTNDLISYLKGVRIRSITRDSANQLWIATWRKYGLIRYNQGEITVFDTDGGLYSDRVRVACEKSDGTMMVANTGGVSIISGDSVVASYGEESGIVNTEILTVTEGENGDMILGSDGGGIYIIGADGTKHIGVDEGLGSEVILKIKKDSTRDIYWIVTTNSIAYMDQDYKVTTVEKFPYPNNFDIFWNSEGNAWVLASDGIYILPVEELLENEDIDPLFCNLENGLPCITTANSYSELTEDGNLYIAGTSGVAKVNIEEPLENVSNIKSAVPYIEADGEIIYPDEDGRFVLTSDKKKITIPCFIFNYSLVNPQVSYRLEGFDKEVTVVDRSEFESASYTNLPGGTYHFLLQVKDSLGDEGRELSVEIVKEKAFYEQIWFYLICLIIVAIIVEEITRFYVKKKTRALQKKAEENKILIREITEAFAKTIDMKDQYTNGHSTRVAEYTVMLAKELGYDEETVERYYNIALLHDIGKISVPSTVLNKSGKLTNLEFEVIKSHTERGYDVLRSIHIMPELAVGAEAHHERPDGRGYPLGLKEDEIPRVAQIIAVADTFDAMYSNRPYRNRMNFEKVVSIIKEAAGTQLTKDVVDAFLRLVERGYFRAPDDDGGGTTEDIQNIHANYEKEKAKKEEIDK